MIEPIVPMWILTLPASLALVALYLSHVRRRGWGEGLLVLVAAVVFWSVRENLQIRHLLLPHDYEVSASAAVRIGDAPIAVIVGWAFCGLLAWHMAERILERARGWPLRDNPLMLLFLTIFIVQSVSYLTEVAGTIAGWWVWGREGLPWYENLSLYQEWRTRLLVTIPSQPLEGWAMYELFFLGPLVLSAGFLRKGGMLNLRRTLLAGAICLAAYAVLFTILVLPSWLTQGRFIITSGHWAAIFGLSALVISFWPWRVGPLFDAEQAKSGRFWEWVERWGDKAAVLIYLLICLAVISWQGALTDYIAAIAFLLFALLGIWGVSARLLFAAAALCIVAGLALHLPALAWSPLRFLLMLGLLLLWRTWQRAPFMLRRNNAG
ncbi:MAG: hypothetical protein P9M14_13105 [Candidatus Alcyoniella australis]|nr:hypothetical protein [Candidatus Alcyoniella australis]